jgi:hypothetical protein
LRPGGDAGIPLVRQPAELPPVLTQECSEAVYVGEALQLSHLLLKDLAIAAAALCLMHALLHNTTAQCTSSTSLTAL